MRKHQLYISFTLSLLLIFTSFTLYHQHLETQFQNKELALLARLGEDAAYDIFSKPTSEDIEKGKQIIASQNNENLALSGLPSNGHLPLFWWLPFGLGIAILIYFFYLHYQKYIRQDILYQLECMMNHHYEPSDKLDAISLQLNALNDYFLQLEKENSATYERMKLFIEDIAHQIKTPLTTLKLYTEMSTDKKTVSKGGQQISRLEEILEKLIDLAKLEAHVIPFDFQTNSFNDCIEQTIKDLSTVAQEKDITIEKEIAEINFSFDYFWMSQALFNLIKNSIEASPTHQTIQIQAVTYQSFIKIDIIDHGHGLSSEDRENLFSRFYSSKTSASRKNQSMGIGLNIALEVVKAHHGTLSVNSTTDKTTFIINLPLISGKEKI